MHRRVCSNEILARYIILSMACGVSGTEIDYVQCGIENCADDESSMRAELLKLVTLLPHHHHATLHHLMTHWCRIIRHQVESGLSDLQELLSSVCQAFYHVLMRPSWEHIV